MYNGIYVDDAAASYILLDQAPVTTKEASLFLYRWRL